MPEAGDRILVFKEPWLSLVLSGRKTMEIRSKPLTGKYFVGMKQSIYGAVVFGTPRILDSQSFRELRSKHLVSGSLPYKKTYGLPVVTIRKIPKISYVHPRGAVGIVRYRP